MVETNVRLKRENGDVRTIYRILSPQGLYTNKLETKRMVRL